MQNNNADEACNIDAGGAQPSLPLLYGEAPPCPQTAKCLT